MRLFWIVKLGKFPANLLCASILDSKIRKVSCKLVMLLLLLLASLHAVSGFTVFASNPAFGSVHTVLAELLWLSFLPVACFSAVVSGHDIAVILNGDCCWRYCYCLCHCCCLHPDSGRHSCCCWRSLSSWWFLSAVADVPGVAKVL